MQRTAGSTGSKHYRTSLEEVTGETPDISYYLDFAFYDWCWYNDNAGQGETKLGKWMSVSHHIGRLMSCLSVGPASKIPNLIHYRVVLFHTPNSGLIDL